MYQENEKVNLQGLPDNVYIKIKIGYRKILFEKLKRRFNSLYNLAKQTRIKCTYLYHYKNGGYCVSLRVLRKIFDLFPDKEIPKWMNKIERNLELIKFGIRNSKPIINPKFPVVFSDHKIKLSRIVGHLVGDGGVVNKVSDYHVHYTNKSKKLIEQFKQDVLNVFGNVHFSEGTDKRSKVYWIQFPSILGIMLMKLFGPQIKESKHIPKLILNGDEEIKSIFLRAIFDDEGSVIISKYTISFTITNKKIAEDVKELLRGFGIRPNKTFKMVAAGNQKSKYKFTITGKKDFQAFKNFVKFDHPAKKRKLEKMLERYTKCQYKKGEFKKLVIDTLRKKGKLTILEIAKQLERTPSGSFRDRIRELEKKNIITSNVIRGKTKFYKIKTIDSN